MAPMDLHIRTRAFVLEVIQLVEDLPRLRTAEVLGRQLLRSATSVGANYRAAKRAKSPADFIAKMGVVEEEVDECLYWLDLLCARGLISPEQQVPLADEANQLLAISIASIKTARKTKARL